jgi:hypothetical protein
MFHPFFSDGTPDLTSPHRPGFRMADTNDDARLAADEAYQKMREHMPSNASPRKESRQDPVRDRSSQQRKSGRC